MMKAMTMMRLLRRMLGVIGVGLEVPTMKVSRAAARPPETWLEILPVEFALQEDVIWMLLNELGGRKRSLYRRRDMGSQNDHIN
ncbi:hypothetical protein YC2023_072659 [Brassica napus]